ncbi:MAG: hypothetical protein R3B13_02950 [Polyangiaceae bacterium]
MDEAGVMPKSISDEASMSELRIRRRAALGALGTAMIGGCGGAEQNKPGVGSPSSGGAGGSAGAGSSGAPSGGGSSNGGASGAAGSTGGAAGSAGAAGGSSMCTQPTPGCIVTDDNILGPFYSAGAPERADLRDGQAGQRLVVSGRVYGCDCQTPLPNAVVDVWQANAAGAYDNVGYVLRGIVRTDATGRYEFTTILPGFYLNGADYRPRHIHFKVSHPQGVALTTQLYFEGDPNFGTDPFWKPGLIKKLTQDNDAEGALMRCEFDVVLA